MTQDQLAFLREIAIDPKDQAKRLIYADWLDEQKQHVAARKQRNIVKMMQEWEVIPLESTELLFDYFAKNPKNKHNRLFIIGALQKGKDNKKIKYMLINGKLRDLANYII
jgi:uncharacterized protein (TIGR02996 family)